MTIKEVREMYANDNYVDEEIYISKEPKRYIRGFHGDFIESAEMNSLNINDDTPVYMEQLMDEEDYNNSILANSSVSADFAEWYDDKDARILCILIAREDAE